MWVVFIFAVLGTAHSSPLATKTVDITDVVTTNNYLLPQESSPTFYDLQLFLNPENPQNFTGSVSIRILPNVPTSQFVLQAQDMTVSRIQVFKADELDVDLFSQYSQAADDTHFLTISLNSTVLPLVPYVVNIDYVGSYATDMFGLYVSSYQQNSQTINLITSQLQPTYARRAFPCYDQPGIKAIFRTTIYAPPSYTVVRTNMPARSDSLKPDIAGYTKHEFQDTLVMSTYLLAFLVSNFNFIENNQPNPIYNKPFRVYSRPGTQDTAEFALDFGQKNMVALENYTDFPYAFPKMDKAAVPDFAAGAMENWGLVIYREAALLVQDGVTTTSSKQGIARIITHENTHQWYGNEVSPVTWTYTWLNEGFANFFESFGTELVLPEWRMMDQMLLGVQNVFQNDAVLSVNPMTYEVNTPSEVIGTFNAVAYQKSGSVIRMMQHFLTPEVFRDGLNLYLKRYSRDSTVPMDLFTALQEALNNSPHSIPYQVQTIMDRWTNQGGFPVIEVLKNAPEANSVSVKQERYLTDPSLSSNYLWHVPLNWVLSSNPDFSDTAPQAWLGPTSSAGNINIPNLAEASWYIVNKQQTGYYRVNYDEDNWVALANVLSSSPNTIHLLNRAQIIDDSFNLARTGRLDYKHPLEISRYLKNEDDYIPWGAASNALNYLDSVLSGSEAYAPFQAYVLDLAAASYEKLGFNADTNSEEHVTPFYRNIILDFYCRYGNEHCVQTAQELLQGVRNNTIQNLNPDVQNTVFCSGLRGGDSDNFNFVWDRYLASDDPTEKSMLLSSLGCTSNSELRDFFLNQVIDDNSQVREQDRHSVIVAVISASTENMDAALNFVVENFDKIQPRVQGLSGTSNILTAFARRLNTQEHMTKIDELERLHGSIFTASENAGVTAIKENIAASISWGNDNMANVEAWLKDNYGEPGSANAISASIIVAISVVVMIFNF